MSIEICSRCCKTVDSDYEDVVYTKDKHEPVCFDCATDEELEDLE